MFSILRIKRILMIFIKSLESKEDCLSEAGKERMNMFIRKFKSRVDGKYANFVLPLSEDEVEALQSEEACRAEEIAERKRKSSKKSTQKRNQKRAEIKAKAEKTLAMRREAYHSKKSEQTA